MRLSSYTVVIDLPGEENAFLLHGYSGAMDIVSKRLADRLQSLQANSGNVLPTNFFAREVSQILIERGYLTDRTEQEEFDFVKKIHSTFKSRVHARFEFRIIIPTIRQLGSHARANVLVDAIFDIISHLYKGRSSGHLATATVDLQIEQPEPPAAYSALINTFLEQATLWEVDLEIELPAGIYPILRDHISKNYLRKLTLNLGRFDRDWMTSELVDFTAKALRLGRQIEWITQTDSWSVDQIEWLLSLRQLVESTLPNTDKSKLQRFAIIPLVTKSVARATPEQIDRQDLKLFRALLRHTGTSAIKTEAVLFLPLSLPPIITCVFQIGGNIEIQMPHWQQAVKIGQFEVDPSCSSIEIPRIQHIIKQASHRRAGLLNCCGASCCFSLLCDNICNTETNLTSLNERIVSEKGDFSDRLRRVAPLLLANSCRLLQ